MEEMRQETTKEVCEWERDWKKKPLLAFVNTVWQVILHPVSYFSKITPIKDQASLALFIYINSVIAVVASFGLQAVFYFVEPGSKTVPMSLPGYVCGVLLGPFVILGMTYMMAGVYHFMFKWIGGSKKTYQTTLTVYGLGSACAFFGVVPVLGNVVSFVYFCLINIGGQAKAHEITGVRAFFAIGLIWLLCCCLFVFIIFSVTLMVTSFLGFNS